MMTLTPGANAPVMTGLQKVTIHYLPIPGADLDISAFILNGAGKVRGDQDMCFFGQKSVNGGAVQMTESSAGNTVFSLDLSRIDPAVEKIALTATIYDNLATFSQVLSLSLNVNSSIEAVIPTQGMKETALILGEFYRRQGEWKFRCVAQGFAGGLEPLAKHFGVDVAAAPSSPAIVPVPTPAPQPVPAKPSLNLSKITLDKSRSTISLEKSSGNFGEIKVNLNWNRSNNQGGGGFFSRKPSAIDLDVGCLFELSDGHKGVVQALGNSFGDFNHDPYIELMGDDRTGSVSDGEWMRINGQKWQEIKRILVFAFIYEGAANWKATDGVVTIYVPDQPPIEVRVSEEGGRQGMCAIALLENENGAVKVTRRIDFFTGHSLMDKAYGWGLRWTAGSK